MSKLAILTLLVLLVGCAPPPDAGDVCGDFIYSYSPMSLSQRRLEYETLLNFGLDREAALEASRNACLFTCGINADCLNGCLECDQAIIAEVY